MICLKRLFKHDTLDNQGIGLSRIVAEALNALEDECLLDFDGIANVSPPFFHDFVFPLATEFGGHVLDNKLILINIEADHFASYRAARDQASDFMGNLSVRRATSMDDMSVLTCDLLVKARELARRDPSAAQAIFGINGGMAEFFANMDIKQIRRVANAGIICFEPRFSPEFAARMAALDASEIDVFLNVAGGLKDFYGPGHA